MSEHPVLAQLTLGYCPMIDRQLAVTATRLTVFPRPDAPPDVDGLLAAMATVWREGGEPVLLNLAGEAWLHALLRSSPPPHVMVEVPAFVACAPEMAGTLQRLHARGTRLVVKGRAVTELPPALLAVVAHGMAEPGEALAGAVGPGGRRVTTVQSGVRSFAEARSAFEGGAAAVLGWPVEDAIPAATPGRAPARQHDVTTIVELMKRVDRLEPADRLEAVLKNDPTLAFRLVRYINAPAFGLKVEIGSFRHALMLLGYQRLRRWLALLLVSAGKDPATRPLLYAAVRRGLLMEELVREGGADDEMRGEMFVCGLFSLVDRLLKQPMDELLKTVPAPERVSDALLGRGGPFGGHLELVRALEGASPWEVREAAERVFLSPAEVNRALLRALTSAGSIE